MWSNLIIHIIMDVSTYSCPNLSQTIKQYFLQCHGIWEGLRAPNPSHSMITSLFLSGIVKTCVRHGILKWSHHNEVYIECLHVYTELGAYRLGLNTLRPRQNGRHFPDDIFNYIFLNENIWISIKISLKFVPKGLFDNIPALVEIMAWCRSGDKPLSEPMMVSLPTHIYVSFGLNELKPNVQ